jgi:hypothetical protein
MLQEQSGYLELEGRSSSSSSERSPHNAPRRGGAGDERAEQRRVEEKRSAAVRKRDTSTAHLALPAACRALLGARTVSRHQPSRHAVHAVLSRVGRSLRCA